MTTFAASPNFREGRVVAGPAAGLSFVKSFEGHPSQSIRYQPPSRKATASQGGQRSEARSQRSEIRDQRRGAVRTSVTLLGQDMGNTLLLIVYTLRLQTSPRLRRGGKL